MSLWLCLCLLVAGLYLSSAAQIPDECPRLLTPLPLDDHKKLLGRWNFIEGYTDQDVFKTILKQTDSSWVLITQSPDNSTLKMSKENKLYGVCVGTDVNLTIDGNVLKETFGNISSSFELLPTCGDCLAFNINTTVRDIETMLRPFGFNTTFTEDEIFVRSFYLLARESSVEKSGLESFRQQANCFGFSQPANFHYDPKKGFCAHGKGKRLTFTNKTGTN